MAARKKHASEGESSAALLGATVRRQRRSLGLSQLELSRLAGCGVDFVYDVEVGKPTLQLQKLLDVLRVVGLELRLGSGKTGLSIDSALLGALDRDEA